jgi:hypothetical protein
MTTEKPQKNPSFFCEKCNFITNNKKDYRRHLSTSKHARLCENNDNTTEFPLKTQKHKQFICLCGKEYNDRAGLWRHKKKCQETEEEEVKKEIEEIKKEENTNDKELLTFLLKENQEFKKMILDLASKTNVINNNTTNNNKFNLNLFLNEKCKDAMNIMDFVDSLKLTLQDLEKTAEVGYVKGISNIIVNGLNQLDVHKRPIHCSDIKRETLYVKDNNIWEKENEDKKKITRAIKHISIRNAKQVGEWTKENKGYNDSMNKKSDKYLKIISEANGGEPEEINKIISNISSKITIDKENI